MGKYAVRAVRLLYNTGGTYRQVHVSRQCYSHFSVALLPNKFLKHFRFQFRDYRQSTHPAEIHRFLMKYLKGKIMSSVVT